MVSVGVAWLVLSKHQNHSRSESRIGPMIVCEAYEACIYIFALHCAWLICSYRMHRLSRRSRRKP